MISNVCKQFLFNLALVVMAIGITFMLVNNGWQFGLFAIPFVVLITFGLTFLRVTPENYDHSGF